MKNFVFVFIWRQYEHYKHFVIQFGSVLLRGHEVNLTFGQFIQHFQDMELFMYYYNHFLRKSLRLGPERQEAENEWSGVWVRSSLQQSWIWRGGRGVQRGNYVQMQAVRTGGR